MYLDKKLIFLAGGTGLVGTSIAQHILDNYPTVRIRATYKDTKPFIKNERLEFVRCDLRLQKDCRKAMAGCDCAILSAAHIGGSKFIEFSPWSHLKENLLMNVQILESLCFEDIKRVVFIGSTALYQEFKGKIKENELDFNKDPHSSYFGFGWMLRFFEKLYRFWHDKHGLEIIIIRASNIFGPYAKFNPETSHFIPAIIRKAVDKKVPFEVWGSPKITRDVIFSEDFARAAALILNNKQIKFEIFNIGSGVKTTVGDVVKLALKYSGHTTKRIVYSPSKPCTINYRQIDCSKARNILGWEPRFSLEEGIKITTEWWIKNRGWWKK